MVDEKFAQEIFQEVVIDFYNIYTELLRTELEEVTDNSLKNGIKLFSILSENHQKVLIQLMIRASIDATSTVLGIIDGTTILSNTWEEFELIYNNEVINGFLQDHFLALVEDNENLIQ